MAKSPEPTHFFARLRRGSRFRTPWGFVIHKGQAVRIALTDPHLAYWQNSSRFEVTESVSNPRSRRQRTPVSRRKSSKAPVKADKPPALTRKQLVDAARELGLSPRSSDNMDAVKKMIEDHNAMILAKAEKDAEAATASNDNEPAKGETE